MKKNCVIIGCGWLGQPLGIEFLKLDYLVYGATRTEEKISFLNEKGIIGFKISFDEQKRVELALSPAIIQHTNLLIFTIPPTGFDDYARSLVTIAQLFPETTKIIFTSSTSVYKEVDAILSESAACNVDHPVFKAEQLLQSYFSERLTILRLAGLIGENRHPVRYFLNKPNIPNGLAPVNLIQLNDVLDVFKQLLISDLPAAVYNICAPEHPSKMDYYSQIAQQKFGATLHFLAEGNGKIIDGSKIVKESGFQYNTSIFEV